MQVKTLFETTLQLSAMFVHWPKAKTNHIK